MTQEEKAKAYDEVVNKLKGFMMQGVDPLITRNDVQDFFPELAESEDERIRKALIKYLDALDDNEIRYGVSFKDMRTWLEKQGEHANFLNKIQIGDKVTRNEDGVLVNLSQLKRVAKKDEKQGEQKSYASETINGKGDFDNGFTRMMEKEQKYAWSEEDEKMLECAIDMIEWYSVVNKSKSKLVSDWLKSLKERYAWKPSDSQMASITCVVRKMKESACYDSELVSLLNDLKKLKG